MITEKQEGLLRSMLGAHPEIPRKSWGYRNRFFVRQGGTDMDDLKDLVSKGMAYHFSVCDKNTKHCFCATKKGAIAVGLKKYQLKQAELE